jgi:hypothetical protein
LKRILSIVGGLFLVLVLLAAGFFGYAAYQGRGLDASSKAYVQENVPAIISTWSKDELLKRSSPQLQKSINEKPEQLDQLFQKLSTLGPMQSFDELVKGDSNVFYNVQGGKTITAAYVATAKFKNGEGHIKVRLSPPPVNGNSCSSMLIRLSFFTDRARLGYAECERRPGTPYGRRSLYWSECRLYGSRSSCFRSYPDCGATASNVKYSSEVVRNANINRVTDTRMVGPSPIGIWMARG